MLDGIANILGTVGFLVVARYMYQFFSNYKTLPFVGKFVIWTLIIMGIIYFGIAVVDAVLTLMERIAGL